MKSLLTFSLLLFFSVSVTAEETPATTEKPGQAATVQVKMETTLGAIVLELNAAKAPQTVENFVQYVKDGFYDGTVFHRVIDGFMVQAGGYTIATEDSSTLTFNKKETRDPIQNEANNGLGNVRGSIAMARTADPHSAAAQFFINVADNNRLNHRNETRFGWGYAVFGKVVEGMDVVDAIKVVETGRADGMSDVPKTPVVIEKMMLVE